jgi:hypothetical protein
MSSLFNSIRNRFAAVRPLPAGLYHYQAPPEAEFPYRLHLRLEPEGNGVLVVNASTVLHLNRTAAEYAYYLVKGLPLNEAARAITQRYRVSGAQARQDFSSFTDRIKTLISTPDLDPEIYLDFGRHELHSVKVSAPYRLDCAITYRLPEGVAPQAAPTERVREELTTDQWRSVMDKAWAAGIPHILFTGGEPTLREDLPDLIAHTERLGQVVGVITDGLRLADSGYLQSLLQSGLDHLMLLLRPGEAGAWQALQNAIDADLATTVHLTFTPENAAQMPAWLERLKGMGARAVSLSAVTPDLREVLQLARNQTAQLGLTLVWDMPVPYSDFNPVAFETEAAISGAGRVWLYVEPDGDVLPAQGQNRVLGNFLSAPWETIWQKAQAEADSHST